MWSRMSRLSLAASLWLTTLAVVIVSALAVGTSISTAVIILGVGIAPLALMLWLAASAAPPTVAEILHSVNARDGR